MDLVVKSSVSKRIVCHVKGEGVPREEMGYEFRVRFGGDKVFEGRSGGTGGLDEVVKNDFVPGS